MPAGFALWNWFATNRYAQIGAAIIGVLLLMRWKEEVDEARGARRANAKAEIKARKTADKIISRMEDESNERIEKAYEAADAIVGDVDSNSLPDDTASILFGPDRRG